MARILRCDFARSAEIVFILKLVHFCSLRFCSFNTFFPENDSEQIGCCCFRTLASDWNCLQVQEVKVTSKSSTIFNVLMKRPDYQTQKWNKLGKILKVSLLDFLSEVTQNVHFRIFFGFYCLASVRGRPDGFLEELSMFFRHFPTTRFYSLVSSSSTLDFYNVHMFLILLESSAFLQILWNSQKILRGVLCKECVKNRR